MGANAENLQAANMNEWNIFDAKIPIRETVDLDSSDGDSDRKHNGYQAGKW